MCTFRSIHSTYKQYFLTVKWNSLKTLLGKMEIVQNDYILDHFIQVKPPNPRILFNNLL